MPHSNHIKALKAGRFPNRSSGPAAAVNSRNDGRDDMKNSTPMGRRAALLSLAALTLLTIGGFDRSAMAASLDELRKQGAIGERFDGLAVARDASANRVVQDVNAKRSAIYKRESKKTGANVTAVGKIYAEQIMRKAPAGTWFLNEQNNWVRK